MAAATAALAIPAGAAMAATPHHVKHVAHHAIHNATSSCGANCSDFSSLLLGPNVITNAYIPGDTGAVLSRGGQPVNMLNASNSRPNADFTIAPLGTTRNYCRSDANPNGILPSNSVACTQFAGSTVYELDWAPYGNDSGYCIGSSGTPVNGKPLTLVRCGSTQGSLMIQQNNTAAASTDGCAGAAPTSTTGSADFSAYISAATTAFSHPYVVTVDTGTQRPENQLKLQQQNLQFGVPKDSQEFCFQDGPAR